MRNLLALAALIALAGCGGGGSTGANSTAEAPPVAGATPPAGKQWTDVVEKTEQGYRMGNPNAPLKLVEYGSRTCPTCGVFGREGMQPLEQKYVSTGKVSYEFREFLVHGPPDLAASLLGTCVGTEPFFVILEQMYQNQLSYLEPLEAASKDQAFTAGLQGKPPGQVATAWAEKMGLIDFVKQRGVPEAKARACLTDQKAIDALAKVTNDAGASGLVTGTPTFILNDKPVEGVVAWSQVEPALRNAGAR
ncbi:DsbA family protein [Sphingomonas sp. DT-204]|uniref:DsbA family protein n=1 Tax=Sphingomonas sp. DT-204 TaxID=3396166 RepID=UPI003F1A23E8